MIAVVTKVLMGYSVAISGATGGLGRELCQQSVEKGWSTFALTRSTSARVFAPYRAGDMRKGAGYPPPELLSPLLTVVHHDDSIALGVRYDALVLALGGKPLKVDDTTRIVRALCSDLPQSCKSVCLVSAYGVGSSLSGANAGIRIMESWYLQDVYAAKREQEGIVRALRKKGIQTLILRPKALSYGNMTPFDALLPRKEVASSILEWCAESAITLG